MSLSVFPLLRGTTVLDLVLFPFNSILAIAKTLISLSGSRLVSPKTDQWSLHQSSLFEGYYSRILDDEGTLVIIFCRIRIQDSGRPYLLHVSYTPSSTSNAKSFHLDYFPKATIQSENKNGWMMKFPQFGCFDFDQVNETVEYKVETKEIKLNCVIKGREAWSQKDGEGQAHAAQEGPEGPLAHLDHLIGQHWFVWSTHSNANYTLQLNTQTVPNEERHVTGVAHLEKNYGYSFPKSWIWLNSFSSDRAAPKLTLAGGIVLPGIQAFLVGYRSPNLHWDFKPIFTLRFSIFGFVGGLLNLNVDSVNGRVELSCQDWTRKIEVSSVAPLESFIPLSCPLPTGFEDDYAHESFEAVCTVKCFTRNTIFSGTWKMIEQVKIERSALEFGGEWDHRFIDRKRN